MRIDRIYFLQDRMSTTLISACFLLRFSTFTLVNYLNIFSATLHVNSFFLLVRKALCATDKKLCSHNSIS